MHFKGLCASTANNLFLGAMEEIRVGQWQNELVVVVIVRKRPLSIGLSCYLLVVLQAHLFSFPPKRSAIPLPELLSSTSLFG